ncbi:MAG: hypothetical protein JSW03_06845 [Candidatus Eiseniibacteriota bacterium]|nr:MAG: hypothetical protein JSW03_06845 [Candidatus Eisenbacteria bacterium]
MKRLLCVMAVTVCVFAMTAPGALASVPYPDNCVVVWQDIEQDAIILCPDCDGSYLDITVRDQFNVPMPGVLVQVTFSNVTELVLLQPCEGTTDIGGHVNISPCASLDLHPDSLLVPTSGVTVTCLGVTLVVNPSPPVDGPSQFGVQQDPCGPGRPIFSPDFNNDQCVEGLDFSYFALDWLSCDPCSRSNFDRLCPGPDCVCVEALDFAIFAVHWVHGPGSPPCP